MMTPQLTNRPSIRKSERRTPTTKHQKPKPLTFHATTKKGRVKKAVDFLRGINWDDWWQEFITDRRPDGSFVFRTAYQFARAKSQTDYELRLIYGTIGPKPVTVEGTEGEVGKLLKGGARLKIPHLGDWQALRAKTYSAHAGVDAMRRAIADRLDPLEASRAAAMFVLDLLANWMNYDDQIDVAFEGMAMLEGDQPLKQQNRADCFFKLKRRTHEMMMKLLTAYLACHGINFSNGVNDLAWLILAAGNTGTKANIAGSASCAVWESQSGM